MARGSHKNRGSSRNNNSKFRHKGNTKTSHSKFNGRPSNKRKFNESNKHNHEDTEAKRQKEDLRPPAPVPEESSSSEDEIENPLTQLLNTFNVNALAKKHVAIDSDSESEEDDNSEDETDNLEEQENDNSEEESDNLEEEEDDISEESDNSEIENVNLENENNDLGEEKEESDEKKIEVEEPENGEDESIHSEDSEQNSIVENDAIEDTNLQPNDPFLNHLSYDLRDALLDSVQNTRKTTKHKAEWPELGKLEISIPLYDESEKIASKFTIAENKTYAPDGQIPTIINSVDFTDLNIKQQIHDHIRRANPETEDETVLFTPLQNELFSVINNYQDLYFNERTLENGEEIRFVYCLHAINHALKTRMKILHHNARLAKKDDVPEEFRDQGLIRPKVLIVVPFRDSALKIVKLLIEILVPAEKGQVINKLRFMDDFAGNELLMPKKNPKPEDYELTFTGNTDDTFKIGIQVTKKSLKLYADFYSSDIIIASPLGLRLTIGAAGESERDYDFLASIELLIFDQTELFLMQNWDHIIHLMNHMHMQPRDSHGTDFSRVRTWSLNGWSKYYRQTLIFSSIILPEINAVFNKKCHNYAGAIKQQNTVANGSIVNVHVQVPQVYRRFDAASVAEALEKRFEFFLTKILPQYKDSIMKQCLVYVPNYFDFVRLRNYFKREDLSFVQICEYSKDAKVARARDIFFHGDAQFLLYSERFHYFRRIRIKGIRHIIFYQPPTFPHFYSEMCNFMQEANQNKKCGSTSNMTVSVIYSKYDAHQMAGIVGSDRLARLATSPKSFHMFTSSDNK